MKQQDCRTTAVAANLLVVNPQPLHVDEAAVAVTQQRWILRVCQRRRGRCKPRIHQLLPQLPQLC